MEGKELKAGKARVREFLIDPLERSGMRRKRSISVAEHEAFLAGLEAKLAYMSAEGLGALEEVVRRLAGGADRSQWPSEISITNNAARIEEPPAEVSRLVRTFLASKAGEAAAAGGYQVELFSYLRRNGIPPNSYAIKELQERARNNQRQIREIEARKAQGRASSVDLAWLEGYREILARCQSIRGQA